MGTPGFIFIKISIFCPRSLLSEAHEGLYSLEIRSGEQLLSNRCPGSLDGCTFKVRSEDTGMCLTGQVVNVLPITSYKSTSMSALTGNKKYRENARVSFMLRKINTDYLYIKF